MTKIKNKKIITVGLILTSLFFGGIQFADAVTKYIGESATITVACSDLDENLSQCKVTSPCSNTCSFAAGTSSGSCSCAFTCATAGTYNSCGEATDTHGLTGSACPTSAQVTCVPAVVSPTVVTDSAASVEETTATLNGHISNDGGAACRVRFVWGDTASYGSASGWTGYSYYSGNYFTLDISSLTKGKTYHFRAEAQNTAGTGYGSDTVFTTKPDAPTSFTATAVSGTQINLSWSKGSGATDTRIIRKTGSYPTSPSDGTQVYYDTGTSFSDTGLTAGTTYYYSAWAVAWEEGYYKYSDAYATANATPVASPTVVTDSAASVEETTATLNGHISNDGGAACRVRFVWGDTASYGSASGWTGYSYYSGNYFTLDISSLTKGKTYHFRAEAQNTAGTGYGSDTVFTTKPDVPSSFTATASGANQINLSWSKGSGAYYTMVRRSTSGYPTSPSDGVQAYYDTGTSFSDTGLTQGTTYYYRAWSRAYEEGYYQYSDDYGQASATPAGLPTVRTDPATNVEETTATLNGAVTATGGADYRTRFNYGDTVSYGSDSPWTGYYSYTTSFGWGATGLTRGKTYHFRIHAQNSAGDGYGSDAVFTTKPDPPSSFTAAIASPTQINLSWSKGSGAYYTMVRRKTGSYPTSPSDGTQAYYDTGTSFSDTGLTGGTTYYYRAWSVAYEEGYSQYSDDYAQTSATTWSGVCSSLTYPTDRWQRVWYNDPKTYGFTPSNCIGNGPDEPSEEFNTDWGTNPPGGYKPEKIGFTSSRNIYFKSGGYYHICAGSDDGINIWLDKNGDGVFGAGEQIFNRWANRSYVEECSFNIKIEGAGYHKVQLDYYEDTNNAQVSFEMPSKECLGECGSRGYPTWASGCSDEINSPCNTACVVGGYCGGGIIDKYGCGASAHWGPYGIDIHCCCCNYAFELLANPNSGSVSPGGSIPTAVTFSRPCDKLGECVFSASGLPSGATASFSPTSCKADWPWIPSCSVTMTISTAVSTPLGTYTITISNTYYAKDNTKPTIYTLTVVQKPDLVILSGWDAAGLIRYRIKNQGTAAAGESYTALYIKNTADTWEYRSNDYEAALSVGAIRDTSDQAFPGYTLANRGTDCAGRATMPVSICADYYGARVDESDETNNCYETTVDCDITPPTSTIGATSPSPGYDPAGNPWQRSNFSVSITDADNPGGSGLASCKYDVWGCDEGAVNCTAKVTGATRTCNTFTPNITVGPGLQCDRQRSATCVTRVYAVDNAGNSGKDVINKEDVEYYNIDWTPPTVQ